LLRIELLKLPSRIFAVDWSGEKTNARWKIWVAEAVDNLLVRLEAGRTREELEEFVMKEAQRDPAFVVGLDFAFSFPESFCKRLNVKSVYEMWDLVATDGERWLSRCEIPFWGKPGRKKDHSCDAFRRTELAIAGNGSGAKPKSIFQVGGAGAVGTGSLRGIPLLKHLHEAGFSIWPFDPPRSPLVVEIYPRLLTGVVNKSSRDARARYLAEFPGKLTTEQYDASVFSEDAFDAAVSALAMSCRVADFAALSQATDACELIEGRIWE